MKRWLNKIFWYSALLCLFSGHAYAAQRIPVFVSIVPQKFFVQQIGADLVDVQVMVKPGASPATYEPKPKQMADLSKAAIYFSIGVPFENAWLDKIAAANTRMEVVPTDRGIEKIPMISHHHHEEAGHHDAEVDHDGHDEEGHHHDHDGLDPHIWLSPPLVKIQAHTVMTALQAIDPAHQAIYAANYQRFASAIDELDRQLRQTFAGKKGLQFMVFHPAWGYFAHTYGLHQVPVEIEGKAPKPAELQRLIEHALASKINVIFVQPQFSTKSARQVAAAIHGQVVPANPLAEEWTANLLTVADKFEAALR